MTRNEAQKRALKIWGPGATVKMSFPYGRRHQPGEIEWWVDLGRRSHALDLNGHVACGHEECKEAERMYESL